MPVRSVRGLGRGSRQGSEPLPNRIEAALDVYRRRADFPGSCMSSLAAIRRDLVYGWRQVIGVSALRRYRLERYYRQVMLRGRPMRALTIAVFDGEFWPPRQRVPPRHGEAIGALTALTTRRRAVSFSGGGTTTHRCAARRIAYFHNTVPSIAPDQPADLSRAQRMSPNYVWLSKSSPAHVMDGWLVQYTPTRPMTLTPDSGKSHGVVVPSKWIVRPLRHNDANYSDICQVEAMNGFCLAARHWRDCDVGWAIGAFARGGESLPSPVPAGRHRTRSSRAVFTRTAVSPMKPVDTAGLRRRRASWCLA
jgi:hypothetical protein